jgi:hypothetical protein
VADRQQPKPTRQTVQGYRQRLRELVSQMRAEGIPEERIADELLQMARGAKS